MVQLKTTINGVEVHCPKPGCESSIAGYGGHLEHHYDGSHTLSYTDDDVETRPAWTPNVETRG